MSRTLTILNGIGVVALAGLCAVQWHRDRSLNLQLAAADRANQQHAASLVEQSNSLRASTADLAEFKQRFAKAHAELADARAAMQGLEQRNEQLLSERDQLKASVTNWAAALAERDVQLKEVATKAQDLAARLNDSIARFNELATNYNTSVRRFNELATNYNNVVEQLNQARAAGGDGSASTSATARVPAGSGPGR